MLSLTDTRHRDRRFMEGRRHSWDGRRADGALAIGWVRTKSAKSLGRWLDKEYAQQELRKAGFEIVRTADGR